ncbi:MAG: hypothetical protein H0X68_11105 [Chloroflexi bacterium]|nr:hypothetical protein [Chloroflexota bacterium]
MSAFGIDGFGTLSAVSVDVYTSAYRVSGTIQTRFTRVAEILNQLSSAYLAVEHASTTEHAIPGRVVAAPSVLVSVDEILVMVATELGGDARGEMRIPKRAAKAQMSLPPLHVAGAVHIAIGSRPIDGLLNVPDRFLPMTDVTLSSVAHPELDRSATAVALRRDRAHLLLVADDERPDELLADVLDERTAEAWLRASEDPG